jgi:hypothetical protein
MATVASSWTSSIHRRDQVWTRGRAGERAGFRRVMFAVEDIDDVVARCGPTGPRSSAKCSTRTRIGWPTSAGQKVLSLASPKKVNARHTSEGCCASYGIPLNSVRRGRRRTTRGGRSDGSTTRRRSPPNRSPAASTASLIRESRRTCAEFIDALRCLGLRKRVIEFLAGLSTQRREV